MSDATGALLTHGTFFYPGPTEVRREILEAQVRPMISHRGRAFAELFASCQPRLRALFGTERPVYVSTSSATGLMEAAMRAVPRGRVLCVVDGAFSERFAKLAESCGHEAERYAVAWGTVPDAAEVERRLADARAAGKGFDAVSVVHSETSTGVMADVAAIARAARAHDALVLVDSVTGIAGAPFHFDAWDVDFALTGSQKALALPPGLAFGVASARLLERAVAAPVRGLYFDLLELEQYARQDQTPNTPALTLIYALQAQLDAIAREGLEARFARHARMAAMTHEWVARWSARTGGAVRLLAPEGARAVTVSAVTLPETLPAADYVRAVADRGFVIGTGYGKLKATTFRIGHMGDHTPDGLARCLAACDDALGTMLDIEARPAHLSPRSDA